MRKYGRIDRNQNDIVDALRRVGAAVTVLSSVGNGCPDILVGFRGQWYMMEIKVPGEHLTEDEEAWWVDAKRLAEIPPCIVYSVEGALRKIGATA